MPSKVMQNTGSPMTAIVNPLGAPANLQAFHLFSVDVNILRKWRWMKQLLQGSSQGLPSLQPGDTREAQLCLLTLYESIRKATGHVHEPACKVHKFKIIKHSSSWHIPPISPLPLHSSHQSLLGPRWRTRTESCSNTSDKAGSPLLRSLK